MNRPAARSSTAALRLGELRHVCAFFNSEDEEYRVLLPFIREGILSGHKAVHVVNPKHHAQHIGRLETAEIDVQTAQRSGQLDLRSNTETYLTDGVFDKDRMLQSFEQIASGNLAGPFPLSRIVCQMDWACANQSHVIDLIEFEARVNDVWSRHKDVVICSYQLSQFGGATVIDIMRTHPVIIIGGIIQQNPFYVPPEVFLTEFFERRAKYGDEPAPADV